MIIIRQNKEPAATVPYDTRTAIGGIADDKKFVKNTGCGICSACMIVENLTDKHLSVEECVQMSYSVGANQWRGTSMRLLGPVVAQRFNLNYSVTDDINEVLEHLKLGGMAIALVNKQEGDEEGHFTKSGHYMALVAYDGEDVCTLDPSFRDDKYTGKEDKVKVDYPFIYSSPETLHRETGSTKEVPSPKYYLFSRKKP